MARKGRAQDGGQPPASPGPTDFSNSDMSDEERQQRDFDEWLKRRLADLYAPVLEEPIPERLVDIVLKHKKGEQDPNKG